MSRVVTLRLPDEVYEKFRRWAQADSRPISNLIQTAALRHIEEKEMVAPEEMEPISRDSRLVAKLRRGSRAARLRQGRMVG